MFADVINTLEDILNQVFLEGGAVRIAVAVAVALTAGFLLKEYKFGAVVNRTLVALIVFALILAIINLFRGDYSLAGWINANIDAFLRTTFGAVLIYFIGFFIVISLAHAVRKALEK